MIYFHNDYNEICHPAVLSHIQAATKEQMPGYGEDPCCSRAAALIRKTCGREDVAVHFLVGGTQSNLTVITAALRPHQGVIAAQSGHINVHETGAIEATGHKVILTPSADGKVQPEHIEQIVESQSLAMDAEHIVQPKMVYISNPTELGTTYSLKELTSIANICKKHGLYLFVDGARMGYGLAASDNDIGLSDYVDLCDVFYIGGTKVGAMFGEAVVITNPAIAVDFRYIMKQRGGMLAKGWLLGLQFEALFTNDLYLQISTHAVKLADRIRQTLTSLGYALYLPGTTNQVFVTLPDVLLDKLSTTFTFAKWEKPDQEHTTVRFCTSWASTEENVNLLCESLIQLTIKA